MNISKKIKYSLLETFLLESAVVVSYYYLNGGWDGFFYMSLHPFLIIAALMALRYGKLSGIISAALTSLYFIGIYYHLGFSLTIFFTSFTYYKYILFFILIGYFGGMYKNNMEEKADELRTDNSILKKARDEFKEKFDKVNKANKQLKDKIISAEDSLFSIYEAAQALETLDEEKILTESLKLIERFTKAEVSSIYTVSRNKKYLRLKLRKGSINYLPKSINIEGFSSLQKVVHEQQVEAGRGKSPVFTAPIIEKNKTIAVINIEKIDFERINDYYYLLFKLITEWINKALSRAVIFEENLSRKKFYKGTKIMKYDKFEERLKEEKRRRDMYKMEYALLGYKLNKNISLKLIDKKLDNSIREVDVRGYDSISKNIYLLLPTTPSCHRGEVNNRIMNNIGLSVERIEDYEALEA